MLRRLLVAALLLLIPVLAASLVGYWIFKPNPDEKVLSFAVDRMEDFIEKKTEELPQGETYSLLEPAVFQNWSIATLAKKNPSWKAGTGAGGFIIIGRLENNGWKFSLPGDKSFLPWLKQLPEQLMDKQLKSHFLEELSPSNSLSRLQIKPKATYPKLAQPQLFQLPYPEKKGYLITTLPGDNHHTDAIKEAIDFGTPEGTDLLFIAAEGTVIEVKENSSVGGCSRFLSGQANMVRVKVASDLSVLYLHLKQDSVLVEIGQKVKQGQRIGKSGNSGFSCGAHLHIVLEKWCGNRICGSVPLRFEEFGQGDPRYNKKYVSRNKPLEERERIAKKQEQERQRQEIEQIKDAVHKFDIIYACAYREGCDQNRIIGSWVSRGLFDQLFPSFCFGCPEKWDENQQVQNEFLDISVPYPDHSVARAKEVWKTSKGGESYTHYVVVDHYLIKESGVWKVDGYKIVCGYVLDKTGKMVPEEKTIEEENLDGCPWQPDPSLLPTQENVE